MNDFAGADSERPIAIQADGFLVHAFGVGTFSIDIPDGYWLLDINLGATDSSLTANGDSVPKRQAGHAFSLLPPGIVRTYSSVRAGHSILFLFRLDALRVAPARLALDGMTEPIWNGIDFALNGAGVIVYDFIVTKRHCSTPTETSFIKDLIAIRLMQIVTEEKKIETNAPRCIQAALEFIDANLDKSITITEIAHHARLSPYHFSRRFRERTGMSIRRYLILQRIEKAQRLITASDLSLAEIAYSTGFSSQSHMTSLFRRFVGRTPGSYRLMHVASP
ncbi:AraC family transcriptional regulator [uncultured Marivita sp.]|uniref:AraC family transcriptional regulator n=1 Tax=uncultured Marivita sp. TaxID=888080 RepID=UPI00262F7A52|nr:AraC family transcriptional regulator [uncultured Marivita sp.]